MKKFAFVIFLNLVVLVTFAQQYDIGIHTGLFSSTGIGIYNNSTPGPYYGIKFDYHLNYKFSLSSNYTFGSFEHTPYNQTMKIRENVDLFYLTFQKRYYLKRDWLLAVGTGIGYYLEHSNEIDPVTQITEYSRDFIMPVELNINKNIGGNLFAGVKTGFFFTPFYSIGSFHLGPEIRYRF
ncbi:hypothetical protein [uncultured Cyclobacterium sp.]|uniref:hypothetical protein n=1 Tax=uncultured Cyclobacterium sp. TaxID=453820 RepID=UPI0030ED7FB6|tara:strand:+ start:32555 stop:33094 length:540 start_codon:yes stop_codon:yes gene_type:complete